METVYLQGISGQIIRAREQRSILFGIYDKDKKVILETYRLAKGKRNKAYVHSLSPMEMRRILDEKVLKNLPAFEPFYLCVGNTYNTIMKFQCSYPERLFMKGEKYGN